MRKAWSFASSARWGFVWSSISSSRWISAMNVGRLPVRDIAAMRRKIRRASSSCEIASSDSRSWSHSPSTRVQRRPATSGYGHDRGISRAGAAVDIPRTAPMTIGDVVTYRGRAVILLGLEPMSVPDRHAHVRDVETGEELEVVYAELHEHGGLAPTA